MTLINVAPGQVHGRHAGRRTPDVRRATPRRSTPAGPLTGSGEPPQTAVGSAVANAFFDATGVRIRQAPMNPANVRAVLKDAGVSVSVRR